MAALERHEKELCTAAPVIHEMAYGIERMEPGRRREMLSAYVHRLLSIPILALPYDSDAAQWHATERARLEKTGPQPLWTAKSQPSLQ
jgi:tRNA(fMet)-specific endonuclease VapC